MDKPTKFLVPLLAPSNHHTLKGLHGESWTERTHGRVLARERDGEKARRAMRYWCKSCEIFVDDNSISRKQHEVSTRHKDGLRRLLEEQHRKNRANLNGPRTFAKHDGGHGAGSNDSVVEEDDVGQWEEVEPEPTAIRRALGSPLRDPDDVECPGVATTAKGNKSWEPTTKQLVLDSDEEKADTQSKSTFKKRKIRK